jgi:hypothetical protein
VNENAYQHEINTAKRGRPVGCSEETLDELKV